MREVLWKILSAEGNLPDDLLVEESEAPVGLEFTIYKKDVPQDLQELILLHLEGSGHHFRQSSPQALICPDRKKETCKGHLSGNCP
jgi:hypothetical protein